MKIKKNISIFMIIAISFFIYYKTNYISAINISDINNNTYNQFNRWENKRWISIGDSITEPNKYQTIVNERLGFSKVLNKGVSGQTMAFNDNKNNYSLHKCKNINYKEYDLVTIFVGTNDFRYNKKLGTIKNINHEKFNIKTFTGAYQELIESILESNPRIQIVLLTPIQRNNHGYDINTVNDAGCRLIDYVNITKELGNKYSLPVLDLYATSGINEKTLSVYTRDGLHPNDEGYKVIAQKIIGFLLSI